jgi:2-polyprenyl-6-methoxyphenol hydroxylase-like FAD-dependent oxidoreductase
VVGAGVAGLTVAARLIRAGRPVRVVEQERFRSDRGYAIGLYPLGTRVIDELGLGAALEARSLAVGRYRLADVDDAEIQSFDMSALTSAAGPMRMLERAALLEILGRGSSGRVSYGVRVRSLVEEDASVSVSFTDGSSGSFDALIACDGAASETRDIFGEPARYDSEWELWTWWAPTIPALPFEPTTVHEWWGPRCFAGTYPAPERTMCVVGGPRTLTRMTGAREFLLEHAPSLAERVPSLDESLVDSDRAYRWSMRDARSATWARGRIALCGDAATGFLPTAGVGASVALRSAWVLADELLSAEPATVPTSLASYERRCRRMAEQSQSASRRLARVMFLRHARLDRPRRAIARRYPAARLLRQISEANLLPL